MWGVQLIVAESEPDSLGYYCAMVEGSDYWGGDGETRGNG